MAVSAVQRHLHAVPEDVEITEEQRAFLDTIEGLERINRKLLRDVAELERDHLAEAEASRYWPVAVRLWSYHQRACDHPSAEWSWQRFEMVLPRLKGSRLKGNKESKDRQGLERCLRAIAGARYDPWRKRRRNGTYFVRNRWDDIFEKPGDFEDFIAKAPASWVPPAGALEMLNVE